MASYRVYYRDLSGKLFSAADIEAPDDAAAIVRAEALTKNRSVPFEVWHSERLVHRQVLDTATGGDKPSPRTRVPPDKA
jgi:hypothetical protein